MVEGRGCRAASTGKFSATVVAARARATHAFGPINSCDRTKGSLRIPAASGAARCGGSFGILQRIITGRCSRDTALSLFRGYPCACTPPLPREPLSSPVYVYTRTNAGEDGRRAPSLFPPPSRSPPRPSRRGSDRGSRSHKFVLIASDVTFCFNYAALSGR